MTFDAAEWGQRFELARQEARLSKAEIARQTGVVWITVDRWGKGRHLPGTEERREKLAAVGPLFAQLAAELPEEPTSVDQIVALRELIEGKVDAMSVQVTKGFAAVDRRLARLEQQLLGEAVQRRKSAGG